MSTFQSKLENDTLSNRVYFVGPLSKQDLFNKGIKLSPKIKGSLLINKIRIHLTKSVCLNRLRLTEYLTA